MLLGIALAVNSAHSLLSLAEDGKKDDKTKKDGNKKADKPFDEIWNEIDPLAGALLIILGLPMAFYGYKQVMLLCGVVVAFAVTYVLTGLMGNLMPDIGTGAMYGLFIAAIVLSTAAARMAYNFYKEWALGCFAASLGAVGALELVGGVADLNETTTIVVAVIFGVPGFYLGVKYKKNKWLKIISTAGVGAFFVTFGLSYYQDGNPDAIEGLENYPAGHYPTAFLVIMLSGLAL